MLFGVLTFAKAQTAETTAKAKPEDQAAVIAAGITRIFDLNSDQELKVKAIYLNHVIAMGKLRIEEKDDLPAMQKKMKAVNDEAQNKVYLILTDSQKEKFNALKAKAEETEKNKQLQNH